MTDAQGRFNAKDELLYVSTSSPASPTDETQYTLVGLLTNNPFSGQAQEIEVADKATSGFGSVLVGTRTYTVEVEAHRRNDGDAGQVILRDAWINGTTIYWLISSNVVGDVVKYGSGVVTAYSEDSANDEVASMSATIRGQGAPTFATLAV